MWFCDIWSIGWLLMVITKSGSSNKQKHGMLFRILLPSTVHGDGIDNEDNNQHHPKAFSSMNVDDDWKETDVNDVHSENAYSPMTETDDGISMCKMSFLLRKAFLPILVISNGISFIFFVDFLSNSRSRKMSSFAFLFFNNSEYRTG